MAVDSQVLKRATLDIILILAGIVSILISGYLPNGSVVEKLLENLGTGLVAAAVVSVLIRQLLAGEQDNSLVPIASANRLDLEREYVQRKYTAQRLDIVSIALTGALESITRLSILSVESFAISLWKKWVFIPVTYILLRTKV